MLTDCRYIRRLPELSTAIAGRPAAHNRGAAPVISGRTHCFLPSRLYFMVGPIRSNVLFTYPNPLAPVYVKTLPLVNRLALELGIGIGKVVIKLAQPIVLVAGLVGYLYRG